MKTAQPSFVLKTKPNKQTMCLISKELVDPAKKKSVAEERRIGTINLGDRFKIAADTATNCGVNEQRSHETFVRRLANRGLK